MTEAAHRYDSELARQIEEHWQDRWEEDATFVVPDQLPGPGEAAAEKFYLLDMFPYPSGAGLHVGHPLGYIATDVIGRFERMRGKHVIHTLGYDAFGLPAEQYALQTGQHPRVTTDANIANMRRQLRSFGLAHDPTRSVSTTDPGFYRWTQWIFLQLFNAWYDPEAPRPGGGRGRARRIDELVEEFESGSRPVPNGMHWGGLDATGRANLLNDYRLAYTSSAPVNWCPGLGTVLANEEVTDEGRSDIGNFPVFKRDMLQWMMRITAYADRLLDDLNRVDWPSSVRLMQEKWIGRSQGASLLFDTDAGLRLEVFTTRPETVVGVGFIAVSPEHPDLARLTGERWPAGVPEAWTAGAELPHAAVQAYADTVSDTVSARSGRDHLTSSVVKSGVFTGTYAINPLTGAAVPIFVADYVITGYGTGVVMGVPGEDQRDWEFATTFGIPIRRTVQPPRGWDGEAYPGPGPMIAVDGLPLALAGTDQEAARAKVVQWLRGEGLGSAQTVYKLRDWLFSRQRYWGEPFPIVWDDDDVAHALPESMLPVTLPEVTDYRPEALAPDDNETNPRLPLERAGEWATVDVDLGDGPRPYRRELNVMPQWAGSCWYELRYLDPRNDERFIDPAIEAYWMGPRPEVHGPSDPGGVDLYVGGVEQAVLHLLYARFWHKALHDLGFLTSEEPFRRLVNQGYIQAHAYRDTRGSIVPAEEVEETSPGVWMWNGQPVVREFGKMGKSLKNVVTPEAVRDQYGADTFRLYEMSMGPLETSRPWDGRSLAGPYRFLQRVWRNLVDEETGACRVVAEAASPETRMTLHRTISAVTEDMAAMRYHTAIAKLITLNNYLTKLDSVPAEAADALVRMLAPLAPHIAEELWRKLGGASSVAYASYPTAAPELIARSSVLCVVQVSGKVRARLAVDPDLTGDEFLAFVRSQPEVVRALEGRTVTRVVARAPKLVNFVVA
jgi:leucyl-tRNA synthetase